jgi:hypothetical protein
MARLQQSSKSAKLTVSSIQIKCLPTGSYSLFFDVQFQEFGTKSFNLILDGVAESK